MPPVNLSNTNTSQQKNAPVQRRGPKGYFQGLRKQFLESHLPAYVTCKKGARQNFWHTFFKAWWARYPWRLDGDQEPPTDNPEEMLRLASVTPGDMAKKALVEEKLTERLKQWFTNRASAANSGRRDSLAWLPLLQRLHQIRNPHPRRRTVVQQFMQDYSDEVNTAFVGQHGDGKDLGRTQRMNLRHDVAKALVSDKYSHLVNELENKAKVQHDAEMDEWKLILNDVSLAENVPQARDTLFDAVYPLLEAIGSYAGCYVTLIAGNEGKDDNDEGFFTAVHWWPGDRSSTKDWTQWDADAFNSGVAGLFLAYAGETNQLSQAVNEAQLSSAVQTPEVPTPSTLSNTPPTVNDSLLGNTTPSTSVQPAATSSSRQPKYQLGPASNKSSMTVEGAKKRKHTSGGSHPTCDPEDSETDDSRVGDDHGDGSSSGDSIDSNTQSRLKRQRVSRIITRSSGRNSTLGGASDPISLAPVATGMPLTVPNGDTGTPTPALVNTTPIPTTSSDDAMDTDIPSNRDAPLTGAWVTSSEIGAADDTHTEGPVPTNSEDPTLTETGVPTLTETEHHSPPSSVGSYDIENVPAFLLHHGKGKWEVNIFDYLQQVKDPHFQKVLSHYLRFEINGNSGASGSLPTAKRPVEISQWSSRARPANLPNYTRGGRTFTDYVDSVFTWWTSIQPPWRAFERGTVSRKVLGAWGVLHAPGINGLLNVVMLVYWWIKILEEDEPEDGGRADYEFMAEDVAWVFSKLSD